MPENTQTLLNNQSNRAEKKKSKYIVYLKSFLICLLIYGFIIIEYFNNGSYADEVIGLVSLGYLLLLNSKIKKYDLLTFVFLIVVIFLGLISNYISGINTSIRSIGIDIVTQTKILLSFYALKYFLTDNEKQTVIDLLVIPSKLFCIVTFFCSIISQFIDIGMTHDSRFGIDCFRFIFTFNFQYTSVYMLVFGVLVCSSKISDRRRKIYIFMAVISIFLAAKSPSLVFSLMFVFLFFYFKRHKRLNAPIIIIMLVGILLIGRYQINTYLMNEDAARHLFFKYSAVTANNYFPLGSGFGTYGSAEAAKNYSSLYYLYGFNKSWGMSPEYGSFLTDTYWPQLIGQFGWIGFGLMIIIYLRLFMTFTNLNFGPLKRAFLYAAFAQFMVHGIGSAILTSSSGMIGFATLALFTNTIVEKDSTFRIPKVRISL